MRMMSAIVLLAAVSISGCVPDTDNRYGTGVSMSPQYFPSAPKPTNRQMVEEAWSKSGQPSVIAHPKALTDEQISAVKEGVRGSLKDPGSAIFGEIAATEGEHSIFYVCGVTNGRNSYGGYVGMSPFYGMLAPLQAGGFRFVVLGIEQNALKREMARYWCEQHGIRDLI